MMSITARLSQRVAAVRPMNIATASGAAKGTEWPVSIFSVTALARSATKVPSSSMSAAASTGAILGGFAPPGHDPDWPAWQH